MPTANYLFQFIFFSYFSFVLQLIRIFVEVSSCAPAPFRIWKFWILRGGQKIFIFRGGCPVRGSSENFHFQGGGGVAPLRGGGNFLGWGWYPSAHYESLNVSLLQSFFRCLFFSKMFNCRNALLGRQFQQLFFFIFLYDFGLVFFAAELYKIQTHERFLGNTRFLNFYGFCNYLVSYEKQPN